MCIPVDCFSWGIGFVDSLLVVRTTSRFSLTEWLPVPLRTGMLWIFKPEMCLELVGMKRCRRECLFFCILAECVSEFVHKWWRK